MVSKGEQKRIERDRFVEQLRAVLEEADAAAKKASEDYTDHPHWTQDGHPIEGYGGARIVVFRLSHRLREALKSVGEVEKARPGEWSIWRFSFHGRGGIANERGSEAACEILSSYYPDDGKFYTSSWVD